MFANSFCYNLCVGFVQYNLLFQEEILLVGGKNFPDKKVRFYKQSTSEGIPVMTFILDTNML